MPTITPISYNPSQVSVTGTSQVGNLLVGTSEKDYGANPGNLNWWATPDQDLGYVIGRPVASLNQPNPLGTTAGVGFWRSKTKTDEGFISIASYVSRKAGGTGPFLTTADASSWLADNGYWTSYVQSQVVTDSLFMKLDASNYTSGLWNDETINGNNATVNGATWLSTDGGIFDLDGLNDNISIPHKSEFSLNSSTPKTIQVWVKFDTLPSLNVQIPVFGKLSSSFAFDGYWGGLFSSGGAIRVVTNGTSIQRSSTSVSTVTTNVWYLFTFSSIISSGANTTKAYINTSEYVSTAHGTDGYSESNTLYLGYIGTGISSNYLNGKIGACYFYTKRLTLEEITQNFNSTKSKYGL